MRDCLARPLERPLWVELNFSSGLWVSGDSVETSGTYVPRKNAICLYARQSARRSARTCPPEGLALELLVVMHTVPPSRSPCLPSSLLLPLSCNSFQFPQQSCACFASTQRAWSTWQTSAPRRIRKARKVLLLPFLPGSVTPPWAPVPPKEAPWRAAKEDGLRGKVTKRTLAMQMGAEADVVEKARAPEKFAAGLAVCPCDETVRALWRSPSYWPGQNYIFVRGGAKRDKRLDADNEETRTSGQDCQMLPKSWPHGSAFE